jgi:hypothetical protein
MDPLHTLPVELTPQDRARFPNIIKPFQILPIPVTPTFRPAGTERRTEVEESKKKALHPFNSFNFPTLSAP